MKLKALVPEILVWDISKSIKFYKENLGFVVEMTAPKTPPYNEAVVAQFRKEL